MSVLRPRLPTATHTPRLARRPGAALLALAIAAATAAAAAWSGPEAVRLELGAFDAGAIEGPWSRAQRADIDPPAATDDVLAFYYRVARSGSALRVPLRSSGPVSVSWRARAAVRSSLAVFLGGRKVGEVLVGTGPWTRYAVEMPAGTAREGLELTLALRPLAVVTGDHAGTPEVLVDFVEFSSPAGLRPTMAAVLPVALGPAAVGLFAGLLGASLPIALAAAAAAAVAAVAMMLVAPLPVLAAGPRLLPRALSCGALVHVLLGRAGLLAADRARLAALVAAGTLAHGALPFWPNHNPPDLETHVTRTLDLRTVPFEREALMRYGSHLPTPSQVAAPGSDLFGTRTLIPYTPVPYLFYDALARLGLDLHWAMTAFNAALLMASAPLLWIAAARSWGRAAAWIAVLLFTLDLPVWHHVGRAHAPASFGAALTLAAFAFLIRFADELHRPGRAGAGALLLCAAALGYSSAVVLVGLFGAVFLLLLAFDARALGTANRRGASLALAGGGALAFVLYYGHYLPGLLTGARGVEAEPDLFPGARFAIFHNESRQALRVWRLGFWMPALAGVLAAPSSLRRAWPPGRPVLVAWLAAWALVMVLKEPAFFPRLLRWAKEDQFLSPLLALLIGGAIAQLPRRWMRVAASAAALAGALALQLRDYWHHAHTLRL